MTNVPVSRRSTEKRGFGKTCFLGCQFFVPIAEEQKGNVQVLFLFRVYIVRVKGIPEEETGNGNNPAFSGVTRSCQFQNDKKGMCGSNSGVNCSCQSQKKTQGMGKILLSRM